MNASIQKYNDQIQILEKKAQEERNRYARFQKRQFENSKLKPKIDDSIPITIEEKPKVTYKSEKYVPCDNCHEYYPPKRLTKSPKRK